MGMAGNFVRNLPAFRTAIRRRTKIVPAFQTALFRDPLIDAPNLSPDMPQGHPIENPPRCEKQCNRHHDDRKEDEREPLEHGKRIHRQPENHILAHVIHMCILTRRMMT